MYARFFGGSHPAGHKETTRRKAVASPDMPPRKVQLMLKGRRCVVPNGARVTLGQCIAEPVGEDDVALHASVSGTVELVTEEKVVLRNDGKDSVCPELFPWSESHAPNARQLAVVMRNAGIVGMSSGDGQPAHKKLVAAAAAPVDTLIVNGVECDPWHTADHRLMLEQPDKVVGGADLLRQALGVKRAIIAVAGDKLDAVNALEAEREALGEHGVTIKTLRRRYPLGEERILTGVLTGRQVPLGANPIAVRCVVFNVATAAAVYDAVVEGRPVTHRIVTVTGTAVVKPRNLLAPIGMPVRELPDSTDGLRGELVKTYLGGPMRGRVIHDEDSAVEKNAAVVEKDTAAVVVLRVAGSHPRRGKSVCIRCGECVSACPMGLLPLYARPGEEGGREACVSCGACSAVCPAELPLHEWMSRKEEGQ